MATAYDIIKRPIITEQSMSETENRKYTFEEIGRASCRERV